MPSFFSRLQRHLLVPKHLRSAFTPEVLAIVEQAIATSETQHRAQIRFAYETSFDLRQLFDGLTAGERAIELFTNLRVWDTEQNSGVLIYVLLAEHAVEIIADRGALSKLGQAELSNICRQITTRFAADDFVNGICRGIESLSEQLSKSYPKDDSSFGNELPDEAVKA